MRRAISMRRRGSARSRSAAGRRPCCACTAEMKWRATRRKALDLGAGAPFGVRREDLIVKDVPRPVVADGRSRYDRWQLARHEARERGSAPSMVVRTVGEVVSQPVTSHQSPVSGQVRADDVQIVNLSKRDATRSGGVGFGMLVHAVLAAPPFDGAPAVLEQLAVGDA